MLNSFASDSLSKSKEGVADDNKMKQGWKKLKVTYLIEHDSLKNIVKTFSQSTYLILALIRT